VKENVITLIYLV